MAPQRPQIAPANARSPPLRKVAGDRGRSVFLASDGSLYECGARSESERSSDALYYQLSLRRGGAPFFQSA